MNGPTTEPARTQTPDAMPVERAIFREVNEHIRALTARWGICEASDFVCECADPECVAAVRMSVADFDRLRAQAGRYVLSRDHSADRLNGRLVAIDGGAARTTDGSA
jgi:hypothetical protein